MSISKMVCNTVNQRIEMRKILCFLCFMLMGAGYCCAQINGKTQIGGGGISKKWTRDKGSGLFGALEQSEQKQSRAFDTSDYYGKKGTGGKKRIPSIGGRLARRNFSGPHELYSSVSSRYGWYEGLGNKLKIAQTKSLPFYYRLSEQDSCGHFTRVEALDCDGRLTYNHGITTHLDGSSTRRACQWLLDGDYQGNLIHALAYDSVGNMVYAYHSSRLPNGDLLGYYTDQYGEPISLLGDRSSYCKYVHVTLDSVGRESTVRFVGRNLHYQKNKDEADAYGIHYVYDTNDRIVRKEFLNYTGSVDSVVLFDEEWNAPSVAQLGTTVEQGASEKGRGASVAELNPQDTEKIIAEQTQADADGYSIDSLGHHGRSHSEDFFYYRARRGYTYRGDLAYILGYNEYGEPSYVTKSEYIGANIFCKAIFGGNGIYYNEYGQEIEPDSMMSFRDNLGKAYFVEVLSQQAYDAGLRSGDMIVRYAGFYYPAITTDFWKYSNELQAQIYMARDIEKDIFVLRFDSVDSVHVVRKIHLPQGTAGQIGFHFIMGCLTKKETERYNKTVQQYLRENNLVAISDGKDYSHIAAFSELSILRPYKINTGKMDSWNDGVREDNIVIAVQVKDKNGRTKQIRTCSNDGCVLEELDFDRYVDTVIIYYTTDGVTVESKRYNIAYYNTTYMFPKEEYDNCLRLEALLPASVFGKEKVEN